MKRNGILCMFVYFLALPAAAEVLQDRIDDVEAGEAHEEYMVKLQHGRVVWVAATDKALAQDLSDLAMTRTSVRIEVDDNNTVRAIASEQKEVKRPAGDAETEYAIADYTPTNLPDLATAQEHFNSMDNRTKSDSQCYNRAHGWAFDLWRTRGLNSMKLFLFFTGRYIRAYRYHWWFHVTPTTYVAGLEHALDRSFTKGPINVQAWTNVFMKNDALCREVPLYSHYRQNQSAEWCYLIRVSQYYRTPSDLELFERNGRTETAWVTSEIRQARQQAFIYWRRYDP